MSTPPTPESSARAAAQPPPEPRATGVDATPDQRHEADPGVAPPLPLRWPDIELRQTRRLTDDTGIFQHALFATPDPNHGYCIDDNARALIAALRYARLRGHDESTLSLHRYLMFVTHAFNDGEGAIGKFRNFMGYDRRWLEAVGSDDSQGRALWALGLTVAEAPTPNLRDLAALMYERAMPGVVGLGDDDEGVGHLRSWAFALLGVEAFLRARPDHAASRDALAHLAELLLDRWQAHQTDDWPWWEDVVTYDNAKLPHALLTAGHALGEAQYTDAGFVSLRWLIEQQTETNDDGTARLTVIGNDGWLRRDGGRARFDQQPLEAYALVDACLDAARLARQHPDLNEDPGMFERHAWTCFTWFLGNNDSRLGLVDRRTGGCRDGLHADGVNRNQGAESTLAYLIAVLELHRYDAESPNTVRRLTDDD